MNSKLEGKEKALNISFSDYYTNVLRMQILRIVFVKIKQSK